PRVTLTASARVFMPRSRPRRASSSKAMILAIRVVPPHVLTGWTGRRPRRSRGGMRGSRRRVHLFFAGRSQSCHSHMESANAIIGTLHPRVQTLSHRERLHPTGGSARASEEARGAAKIAPRLLGERAQEGAHS